MNEIDKLFATTNPIPIFHLDMTEEELKQGTKDFDAMAMTPNEEAELKEDIQNGTVIL